MCLSGVVYAHECRARGDQRRASDPLTLELQVIVSRLTWGLGPR